VLLNAPLGRQLIITITAADELRYTQPFCEQGRDMSNILKMLVIAVAIASSAWSAFAAAEHGYYDSSAVVSPYWVGKIHAVRLRSPHNRSTTLRLATLSP
jgi:hypothetical protein